MEEMIIIADPRSRSEIHHAEIPARHRQGALERAEQEKSVFDAGRLCSSYSVACEVSCPGDTWRALEISLPCEGQADRGRPTTGYREFEERMGLRKGRYERDRENADIACWC